MATTLLCRLPHTASGAPKGWSIGGLVSFERLLHVRVGLLNGIQRDLVESVSAEAIRSGTCRNHVSILRGYITDSFIGPR